NVGVLNVEEIDIILKNLVYENKIKEIFFSGRNDLYNLAGHFSSIENTYDENFYFDKTKLNIAKNIIKSFKFIDIKK
ncbi:MAG: hypothetical protein U9O66_00335, partial [Patescibacteria group bacterium]|nr:hypothetical protein [Patescibacteria group bacterium]